MTMRALRSRSARFQEKNRSIFRAKPRIEPLERRLLLTASNLGLEDLLSRVGPDDDFPIPAISDPNQTVPPSGPSAANPISSIPHLSSDPGATTKLFLDF